MNNNFGLKKQYIIDIHKILFQNKSIKKVLIFGSRAKNTYHERSDIDLIIIFDKALENENSTQAILSDLEETNIPLFFDIKEFNSIKYPPLIRHIKTYSKVFYEQDKMSLAT